MAENEKLRFNQKSFVESGRMKEINQLFNIESWGETSKQLVYLSLPGIVFFILNLFAVIPYAWNWFYVLTSVLLLGFLFRSYNQSFNFVPVLIILLFLVFIPTNSFQMMLTFLSQEEAPDVDVAESFTDSIGSLNKNPLEDARGFALNFIDAMNWIVFIAAIAIGGSTIGDFMTGNWGDIAKKAAQIAAAIAVMTFVYGMMELAIDDQVRTVWDTVGAAWGDLLEGIGLAQLDAGGNTTLNARTVGNGIGRWIPISFPFVYLAFGYYMRDKDIKTIMTVRKVSSSKKIEVDTRRLENISMYMLVAGIVLIVVYVGYFLTTSEQSITMNPFIILAFFTSSLFVIILLMFNLIIVIRMDSPTKEIWRIIKYTVAGMLMLYFWFQIAQFGFYSMNWIDSPNAQMTFSQAGDFLDNKIVEQLFMVATPETLIFQIAFVGIGNSIYYRLRRNTMKQSEATKLKGRVAEIKAEIKSINIARTTSKTNIRRLARYLSLHRELTKLRDRLDKPDIERVSYRYFIIPTIISAVIGSFVFSLWHSFRRGVSFWIWWQNPMFGMVYWGAGMILSAIAFFCPFAAILVHFLNNFVTLIMAGAL